MSEASFMVEPVVIPYLYDRMDIEVRCFLVRHRAGLVLVDAGVPNSPEAGMVDSLRLIDAGLNRVNAAWADISDVIVTHAHSDHFGVLNGVVRRLGSNASLWAGAEDISTISRETALDSRINALDEGDYVRELRVLSTPGHTAGHICLMHDEASVLFMGDLVDTLSGRLAYPPESVTADSELAQHSLNRVARLDAARVLFSHGGEIDRPLTALRAFLENSG